ncbi:unnamed protein product [Euphydryas editha]|uniref:Uncharacterized protein n=1 Tax=Euphydryas editha TaxID=104508 RepID=A0AAU9UYF8_EUPED|nr:unnamed protein product [Euphydryas editha]
MDTRFCEVNVGRKHRKSSMEPTLEAMHPLDPPPPDVLLALLARNKALEGTKNHLDIIKVFRSTKNLTS